VKKDAAQLGKMSQEKFKLNPADVDALIKQYQELVVKWEKAFEGVGQLDEEKRYQIIKAGIFDKLDAKTYGLN
jgi:hypothetical protein